MAPSLPKVPSRIGRPSPDQNVDGNAGIRGAVTTRPDALLTPSVLLLAPLDVDFAEGPGPGRLFLSYLRLVGPETSAKSGLRMKHDPHDK